MNNNSANKKPKSNTLLKIIVLILILCISIVAEFFYREPLYDQSLITIPKL